MKPETPSEKSGTHKAASLPRKTTTNKREAPGADNKSFTELQCTEEYLRQSEEKYRNILDSIEDAYYETDLAGNLTFFNDSLCRISGRGRQQLMGMSHRDYTDQEAAKNIFAAFHKVFATGQSVKGFAYPIYTQNGDQKFIEASIELKKDDSGKIMGFRGIVRDVTERKVAEEALRQSEEKYRTILESIEDGYYEVDLAGNLTFFNDSVCRISGYSKNELTGMNNRQYMDKGTVNRLYAAHNQVYKTNHPGSQFDFEIIRKDGTRRIVQSNFSLLKDKENKPTGFSGMIRDVTAQKLANEALRISEEKYRQAFSSTSDIILMLDREMKISSITPSVEKILGYKTEELIQRRIDQLKILTPVSLEQATAGILKVLSGEPASNLVYEFIAKDGSITFFEVTVSAIKENGAIIGLIAIARDVTERKRMEEAIVKSEERYRSIVENSQEGIFQALPYNQHLTINPAFADMLGYISPEDAEQNITSIADQIYVHPEEYGKVLDIIRRQGSLKGYETEFYRKDKSRIWVNMSISTVRDSQGRLLYYHGIVEDITPKKKLEQERKNSIDSLRKSLGATINAMSATAEARDPYTAGHQRRVADLARAIATEMKLSRDQIDGIRMAGMIHDLGKISVPSEILTKPTKLTNLEMELIKTHSEAGYNILKDIEFPWPIARIVLEHHERIDGSGYPNELKGEDILLESKIISIADVVEAISSHRPYRPAFGIEPALAEIAKNRGILYDAAAADACLKLFQENRYKMPE